MSAIRKLIAASKLRDMAAVELKDAYRTHGPRATRETRQAMRAAERAVVDTVREARTPLQAFIKALDLADECNDDCAGCFAALTKAARDLGAA